MASYGDENIGVRVVVGIVCVLTILGSVVIIVSFLCFRSLRSKARLILLHLSVMDLAVGASNLIGLLVFYRYYDVSSSSFPPPLDGFCKFQAFVAEYATLSSVLWTVSLAVYMYVLVSPAMVALTLDKTFPTRFVWASCAVSYGLPFVVTLWLLATGRLGYSPEDSAGWCTVVTYNNATGKDDTYVSLIGYDLWMYLAIFLITVLYVASRINMRYQMMDIKGTRDRSVSDYKFALIPFIFLFLRMWTAIQSLLLEITSTPPDWLVLPLLYLTGIGDSAQGFANAVLFVCFTKAVRHAFLQSATCKSCRKHKKLLPKPSGESKGSNINSKSVPIDRSKEVTLTDQNEISCVIK
eukprot:Em0006g1169a